MKTDFIPQSQGGSGTSEHTSQIVLQYPTLSVDGTPSIWLSRSEIIPMASNPDYSASDDTSSSLGDSNYDFVDDKSGIASDDEDHENLTHSTSSNEEREPPQLEVSPRQNVWGCLPAYPTTILAPDYVVSGPCQSSSFPASINEATLLPAGSTGTIKGGLHTGDETKGGLLKGHEDGIEHSIVLEEPFATGMDPEKPFESECTLKVFNQNEASEVTMRHVRATAPSRTLTAVVKQTMIKQWLALQTPYKLLFVGDSAAREEIVWKVGSALDASSNNAEYTPNQYAVVRIPSFENATAGGVELIDSTGISLIVEECNSAASTKMNGGNDTLSMTISNQGSSDQKLIESVWSGVEHRVTDDWSLPDLAIFYLSEGDDISAKQTRYFARKFMSRHQVPCIVISQAPLWDRPAEVIALDYSTLHICLKTHDSSTSIVKRLPVDLKTFMNLDASQMNRNLAYLAKKHTSSRQQGPTISVFKQNTSGSSKFSEQKDNSSSEFLYIKKSPLSEHLSQFKRIFLPSLFLVCAILLYQVFIWIAFMAPHVPARQETGMNSMTNIQRACPKLGTAVPMSVQSDSALMTKPVSLLSNKASDSRGKSDLASNPALTSFLHGRQAFAPNQSENFEAGIIGDCHIVLRSPRWFIRSRKTHKLAFNVTRSGSVLHHHASMPFDGVYALEVPRADAYGTVRVSLWTTSKPIINESLEVDFGTSWLKASTWNKAAQVISSLIDKSRDKLVSSIMVPYRSFATNLGHLVPWRSKTADEARKETGKPSIVSPDQGNRSAGFMHTMAADSARRLLIRLGDGSNAASKDVIYRAKQLCKGITDYSYNSSLLLLEERQRLPQAVISNLGKIARDMARLQSTHLRKTQKKALKFWWRIRGLPRQGKIKDMERGKSHMQNGRFMKKTNR